MARVATGRQNIVAMQGLLYISPYLTSLNCSKVDTMGVRLARWL